MSWFNAPPAAPPPRQPSSYAPVQSNPRVAPPPSRRPAAPRYEDSPPMEKRERARAGTFNVIQAPSAEMALTNALIANERDWPGVQYAIINQNYPFSLKFSNQIPPGSVGTSRSIRQWAGLSQSGDTVQAAPLDHHAMGPAIYLASLDLELAFWHEQSAPSTPPLKQEDLSRIFTNAYDGLLVSVGHLLVFDFNGVNFKAVVKGVGNINLDGDAAGPGGLKMGIVTRETDINWMKDPSSSVKIQGSAKKAPPNAILAPNFKFSDMGIGGLDSEFSSIFRRAFASRIFPPLLVEKLGIQHVKGILLFGPPGTGKTLMARQIGKMLNAREPKIVNGPEILNKFVGASEENVRKLFADAEKEYKEKGDDSGLHIIIFDELDAICKQRGSTNNGTGVGDSVVNQLLSKMDGVEQLNNILIIGMTNRMDMIDEALLRPGRLEVHIEISLPDEKGRVQILEIQTAKMRTNGVLGRDVDVRELAGKTKNFSGAELGGLVKSATSFAFGRHVKVGTQAGISDDIDSIQVGRSDFMLALNEVQPAFGVNEEELEAVVQNGIIHFDNSIHTILRDGKLLVEQVRVSQRTPLVSVLIHGPPGSGKTALAATIAQASQFPFIKLISAENMIGFSEVQKINYLNKVFMDSYKSPLSVIVVDGIERILEWVPIGPRFSNSVLQAFMILLSKRPPKGRRLLILSTTSNRSMLSQMDAMDSFSSTLYIPAITTLPSLAFLLRDVALFSSANEEAHAMELLEQAGMGDGRLIIGVKKLLSLVEMCRQDREGAGEAIVGRLIDFVRG